MLMVLTPATLPSLSHPVPTASWGFPYNQLTEEEKMQFCFTDNSVLYAGNTCKWMAATLQPLSGTFLKECGKRNSSSGQKFYMYLAIHFPWKEKWTDEQLYTYSRAVAHGLPGWSGPWKDNH